MWRGKKPEYSPHQLVLGTVVNYTVIGILLERCGGLLVLHRRVWDSGHGGVAANPEQ